jgi:hypothetical protein
MTISFACEHCGKRVEAPEEAGGRRGRCPYCKNSCYIPSPVREEDLIDLAPEDAEEERRRKREVEALRRQDRALIADTGERPEGAPEPIEQRETLKPEDLHHFIVNYVLDLSHSQLERAQKHLAELKKVKRMARAEVDRFLAGDLLEPALDAVPAKLRMGFLNQLKAALA